MNQLKFKNSEKLLTIENIARVNKEKTEICQHATGWTPETLGSRPIMSKNLPPIPGYFANHIM